MKTLTKVLIAVFVVSFMSLIVQPENARGSQAADGGGHGDLGALGAKLSDPTSDTWALFTEFDLTFSRGDLSDHDYKASAAVIFQPIMPFKVTEEWKVLTRPTVPFIVGSPVPTGVKANGDTDFDYKNGLGDVSLPLMFSPKPKAGQAYGWGFGPTLQFPTHTSTELGTKTWEAGPAGVLTYKTKKVTMGVLGQYWWSYSEYDSDQASTSHGSMLPFCFYNLPDAWQVGFSPTVTYNEKATSDNKWNVPLGVMVTKTTMMGKLPVKFQLGTEYAVKRQDDFGSEWKVRLNVIPVINSFQKKPWF